MVSWIDELDDGVVAPRHDAVTKGQETKNHLVDFVFGNKYV